MFLALFGFVKLSFLDVLDILVVAVIIFLVVRWLRGSAAWSIFLAIVAIYLIRVIASALGMGLTARIVDTVLNVGVLALIVIFQPEVRRFLVQFGNSTIANVRNSEFFSNVFKKRDYINVEAVNELTEACKRMSEAKTGALIVIQHRTSLEDIIDTGDRISATIHRRLIMNIFFKNSPLHDGAMIIRDNVIEAARCTLPITEKLDIPAKFGMRHKAAIGVTEQYDAVAIVVSEETGEISFMREGGFTEISNINELRLLLNSSYAES